MREVILGAALGLALPCLADTTQFLLIPMSQEVSGQTTAEVIEPPKKVTFKALDCATTANLGGIVSENSFSTDASKDYSGTAYSSEVRMPTGQVSGFVMNRPLNPGARLSGFKVAESGQTCSELIDGKPFAFRKYVATVAEPAGTGN